MRAPSEGAGWERLFWLVFQRTSNPIVLLDDERRIVEINDAALALFGGDRADVVDTSIADSIRPEERGLAARDWEAFLRSGEYAGTRALVRADGSEVQVAFAARLALVGGRRLAIYVAVEEDGSRALTSAQPQELPLTKREREVVTSIALGRQTAQIAQQLHISPETVRTHVRNAMSKLGAHTRAQLVAIAICTDQVLHGESLKA